MINSPHSIPTNPQLIAGIFKAVKGEAVQPVSPSTADLSAPDLYQIRMASSVDAWGLNKLIQTVKANLKLQGKSHFLKDKTQDDLAKLLATLNSGVVIMNDGTPVGFASIMLQSKKSGANNLPDNFNQGNYLTIGSIAVHPEHIDRGLGNLLVAKTFEAAASSTYLNMCKDGYGTAIMKIAKDNIPSQKIAKANGFIVSNIIYYDAQGDYHFEIWEKDIPPHPSIKAKTPEYIGGLREQAFRETLAKRNDLTHC